MCYYDQHKMTCGCYKWGHFRQHCTREYRTGETCGMRLIMNTYHMADKCKLCTKIDTKERAIRKEGERIRRWRKEAGRTASISKSEETIEALESEIYDLQCDVEAKKTTLK